MDQKTDYKEGNLVGKVNTNLLADGKGPTWSLEGKKTHKVGPFHAQSAKGNKEERNLSVLC